MHPIIYTDRLILRQWIDKDLDPLANERSRRVMERLGMTHTPKDDPDLAEGHTFRRLVLYRLKEQDWRKIK